MMPWATAHHRITDARSRRNGQRPPTDRDDDAGQDVNNGQASRCRGGKTKPINRPSALSHVSHRPTNHVAISGSVD